MADGRAKQAPIFVEKDTPQAEEESDASPDKGTIEHNKGSMNFVGLHPLADS